MKLAEIFDVVELLDCITLFLSNKVLSRSLSCRKDESGHNFIHWFETNLRFLLQIKGIDFFELSLLDYNKPTA